MFEANGLPYAAIKRPEDLIEDPHLRATGGLAPMTLPSGQQTETVLLPFTLHGRQPGVRLNPPRLGEHNLEILQALGFSPQEARNLSRHLKEPL
jgi:crotonobetainyl-CoA:carnitine CoA-transferase CaiB-like acyl-CoA transferase